LRLSTGAIDRVAHQLLASHLTAANAKAILVAGTTGRGGSLSMSDRLDLTHASSGTLPVIVGVEPEISQEHVIELAHAGAKALLVAFRSGADLQEAIELLSLCRTNGLEMIAYHHPSVHDPLPRQWWPALRELFVQVKNSDPDPQMLRDMLDAGLSVLVGSSARLIDSYRAAGVLSGIASVHFDLVEASADGDLDAHADLTALEASLTDRISEIEHRARLLVRR
jgi:dihydrodipicolinate synthase/N-acetylneuraminate lyase